MLENVFGRNVVSLLRLALRRRQRPVHLPAEPRVVLDAPALARVASRPAHPLTTGLLSTVVGVAIGVTSRSTDLATLAVLCVLAAVLAALAQQTLP